MTRLSVNVNKIATLRNARGENVPDVLEMAKLIESFGADGITVHPRPDQRHIRYADVLMLKAHLTTELNVEGYPNEDFISFMQEIRPAQVTLVPDPPDVLTSNAGFRLIEDYDLAKDAIRLLKRTGARLSIFIDPKDFFNRDVKVIKNVGADRVELYTKAFADRPNCEETLARYVEFSKRVEALGIAVNAGHDLSLKNLGILLGAIPSIAEVSIGHALIADALILGMKDTIKQYLAIAHTYSRPNSPLSPD